MRHILFTLPPLGVRIKTSSELEKDETRRPALRRTSLFGSSGMATINMYSFSSDPFLLVFCPIVRQAVKSVQATVLPHKSGHFKEQASDKSG